jgi:hypothetical protein
MAGLTLDQAEAKLAEWMAADTELQNGQTVKFGERFLTRADAAEVRQNIDYWQQKCQALTAASSGLGRSRTVTPNW